MKKKSAMDVIRVVWTESAQKAMLGTILRGEQDFKKFQSIFLKGKILLVIFCFKKKNYREGEDLRVSIGLSLGPTFTRV